FLTACSNPLLDARRILINDVNCFVQLFVELFECVQCKLQICSEDLYGGVEIPCLMCLVEVGSAYGTHKFVLFQAKHEKLVVVLITYLSHPLIPTHSFLQMTRAKNPD